MVCGILIGLWDINPIGLLNIQTLKRKDAFLNMLHSNFDYVGFTYGSWLSMAEGNIKVGIGGMLLNRNNEIIFSFSGPTIATSPWNAEKEACLF